MKLIYKLFNTRLSKMLIARKFVKELAKRGYNMRLEIMDLEMHDFDGKIAMNVSAYAVIDQNSFKKARKCL